ncbi:MAG TPA: AlpA family phage regulatory protein [Rhodocyclaceae bacterium]|nr:AlpA family phage regulatory protein [Rhodocyclaceae bacterium]HUX24252.1 AlpA family phage regulatory protein [Burkholderiales bacterium]
MANQKYPQHDITLDRRPAVEAATGKRRSAIYLDVSRGVFPPPIRIGARAVAWPRHEYQQVVAARVAGRGDDDIRELVNRLVAARKG